MVTMKEIMATKREILRVRITTDFVNSFIEPETKVLDVGTGAGKIATGLKSAFIVGVDPDLGVLKYSRLRYKVRADASNLPFRDNSFDVALLTEVLEHLSNPKKGIKEAHRVSERLVLSTPNNCIVRRALWKLRGRKTLSSPYHLREYSWNEVKGMAESVGYELRRYVGIGFVVSKPIFIAYRLGRLLPRLAAKMLMEYERQN